MLRVSMLSRLEVSPVICETHGGEGLLYQSCYPGVVQGVVFEKDMGRAECLARQRPTWAVYAHDCVDGLEQGAGAHLEVNVLDVDPFGDPWPAIGAFFASDRPRASVLWVAVNDGLRNSGGSVGGRSGWKHKTLADMAVRFGNDSLYENYLEICQLLMTEKAAQADYVLDRFGGYYCGAAKRMTHYLARLELTA